MKQKTGYFRETQYYGPCLEGNQETGMFFDENSRLVTERTF